jgi:hypothetical protein
MKGRTVISSKEQTPYLYAWEKYKDTADIDIKDSMILWKFKDEDEAIRAAKLFMNLGCEYVQRV